MTASQLAEVLDFVKQLGVGVRHPRDDFYDEGNDACQALKPFGICDFDNEDFYHKPYPKFSCHIPGCERTFETVMQYESHYNSCHSFTCKECNKNLPNFHLLDLHILETHDSFFLEQAKRKPMYKCLLEECQESFQNPHVRRDHCIKIHKYPSDFRFDSAKRKPAAKKNTKKKISSEDQMDIGETLEESSKMDTSECKNKKTEVKRFEAFKGFSFGRGQGRRKPVLYNFSKDLMNSLPQS